MSEYPSITCPKCGRTSYNRNDIEQGYCGHCHAFHGLPLSLMPASQCPNCNALLDCATLPNQKHERPQSGDFTICLHCAEILVFTETLQLRRAEFKDFMEAPPTVHAMLTVMRDTARQLIKEKP